MIKRNRSGSKYVDVYIHKHQHLKHTQQKDHLFLVRRADNDHRKFCCTAQDLEDQQFPNEEDII
jgi:hypothetical protein